MACVVITLAELVDLNMGNIHVTINNHNYNYDVL